MSGISTGTGLISGINTAQIIEQLLAIEARPKQRLQQRISNIEAQQTALLDINARLLNLKSTAGGLRTNRIFQGVLASSSNEEVATASAEKGTPPGSYSFVVKQMVRHAQVLSGGFTDRDITPLGLDQMSFEFGNGRLSVDRSLEDLNGGAGVDRGTIEITDRSGATASVDLSDVTSVNEVLDRINDASGVSVQASVSGDGLVITDTSGGGGTLTVADGTGDTTATDLGIAGSDAGGTITGSDLFFLSGSTRLSALNDGNGVAIRDGSYDLQIFTQGRPSDPDDPREFQVDLGAVRADIDDDTALGDLNNGDGITIDEDSDEPDIKFTDRTGTEHEVDLTGVTTVGQLKSRINTATGGAIQLSVVDGDHFVVTDTTGGGGLLKVQGAGPNGDDAAEDLGILETAGVSSNTIEGDEIQNTVMEPAAQTIQDVLDRINNAVDVNGDANDGHIVASIAADGKSLVIEDTVDGNQNLIIRGGPGLTLPSGGNGGAATDLGINTTGFGSVSTTHQGTRIIGSLNSIQIGTINGGSGLDGATSISFTDRSGASFTLNDLDTHDTLQQVIDAINDAASSNSVDVSVALNSNGTGLTVTDSSGGSGNLIVTGDASSALGIETDPAGVAESAIDGTNLQRRYVDEATKLSDLNYGRGIGTGSFRITDGFGATATINVNSNVQTVDKLLQTINAQGLAINARVNDNGDGIIIEEDLSGTSEDPFVKLKVDSVSGTSANDLNLLGSSETVENASIDGSYEQIVDLDTSDDLNEVVGKINDAGIPVTASIINTGSGDTPFRISMTSQIGGTAGDLIIDSGSVDLGFNTTVQAQDAKVFFGAESAADGFLITSSTNTIEDVVEGLTVNLESASDDPVTIDVSRDDKGIVDAVKSFVAAFNDAIGRIDEYDFFNTETEERGVLLGNPTTSRVRAALFRTLRQPAQGIDTQYTRLSEVGITIGSGGTVEFDEGKFTEAFENDPAAVENLFTAFKATSSTTEEIAPGVTISSDDQTFTKLGVADLFDQALDDLTNSVDGVVKLAENSFEDQIELLNERIAQIDEQLAAKEQRLRRQFSQMELALAQLQSQSDALQSLSTGLSGGGGGLIGL